MPRYEYVCPWDGETVELLRGMVMRDEDVPCPECDEPMKRKQDFLGHRI
jgi:putative FmdB family regulatory protein